MIEFLRITAADFWEVLCQMAPFLLFGFFVAGLLSVFVSPAWVERRLGGRGAGPVIRASLFGIPLPLCSCGVIPVAASLRRHGASRGATTAFVISTPQTGVDSILVTLSLLGPVFAVFRALAALITGVVGGGAVALVEPKDDAAEEEEHEHAAGGHACEPACCARTSGGWLRRVLTYGFVTLPADIGRGLILGILVAGALSAAVPDDYFAGRLGQGLPAMLVMMLVGLPIYVCATASVPVAAALMLKGVSPGAAFVFLVVGPASNAASLTTMWKLIGRRATVIYLLTVGLGAIGFGLLLEALGAVAAVGPQGGMHAMLPHWVEAASAAALLVMLAFAMLPRRARRDDAAPQDVDEVVLSVKGMTCSHCEQTVRRALLACANVTDAQVDRRKGRARVFGRGMDAAELRQAVANAGFQVAGLASD